jgi:hypothetical protein
LIEELDQISSYITVRVYMVNGHKRDTAVKRFELAITGVKALGIPVHADDLIPKGQIDGLIDLEKFKGGILLQGRPTQGWVRFIVPQTTVDQVENRTFVLTVIDVWGVAYRIKGMIPADLTHDIVTVRDD